MSLKRSLPTDTYTFLGLGKHLRLEPWFLAYEAAIELTPAMLRLGGRKDAKYWSQNIHIIHDFMEDHFKRLNIPVTNVDVVDKVRAICALNTVAWLLTPRLAAPIFDARQDWKDAIGWAQHEIRRLYIVIPVVEDTANTLANLAWIIGRCPEIISLTIHIRMFGHQGRRSLQKHLKSVYEIITAVQAIKHSDPYATMEKILVLGCSEGKDEFHDNHKYQVAHQDGIHDLSETLYPDGPTEKLCKWYLRTLAELPRNVKVGYSLRIARMRVEKRPIRFQMRRKCQLYDEICTL